MTQLAPKLDTINLTRRLRRLRWSIVEALYIALPVSKQVLYVHPLPASLAEHAPCIFHGCKQFVQRIHADFAGEKTKLRKADPLSYTHVGEEKADAWGPLRVLEQKEGVQNKVRHVKRRCHKYSSHSKNTRTPLSPTILTTVHLLCYLCSCTATPFGPSARPSQAQSKRIHREGVEATFGPRPLSLLQIPEGLADLAGHCFGRRRVVGLAWSVDKRKKLRGVETYKEYYGG